MQVTESNGVSYDGEWRDGVVAGMGVWQSPAGRYKGEFRAGNFHGKGSFMFPDGDVFEGVFGRGNPLHGVLSKAKSGRRLQVTFSGLLCMPMCKYACG